MKASTRRTNAEIERARRIFGDALSEVPEAAWPFDHSAFRTPPLRVWCSRLYSVVLFSEGDGRERLSVSMARVNDAGRFRDGLTWDDLDRLKREAGYGDRWAVECFPPAAATVNVSNMRHLWLLDAPPVYGWR